MTAARAVFARTVPRIRVSSLGGKLLLILAAVALTGAVALMLLLTAIITPSFAALERQSIEVGIDRARGMLESFGEEAEDAALSPQSAGPNVGGITYLASDGGVLAVLPAAGGDAASRTLVTALRSVSPARVIGAEPAGHFFVRTSDGLAVIGLARIKREGLAAAEDYVAVIRPLSTEELSHALQYQASVEPTAATGATAMIGAQSIRIALPVIGGDGRSVAAIGFDMPRSLSNLGRHVLWLAVGAMTVLLLIVLAVLRRMISTLVLRPLGRIEAHMQRVRDSRAFSPLAEDGRSQDEIASLGHSFNSMLAQLKGLSERVEAQGFALGRTESAVAVMHNVRNALTPVTTILGAGLNQAEPADRRTIGRALEELSNPETPFDRRVRLIDFVAAAFAAEDRMRAERRDQLKLGRDAMSQVLEIIGEQQALAHARPQLEECDATQVVAQNATIARHSGNGGSIAFSFPARVHPVMANRLLLSQVIGNLFSNAADAIMAIGGAGTIGVTIEEGDGVVEIVIRDDGEGFDPVDAPTLFQRGYSTRANKTGGLGLHWCANSMVAMSGTLRLESEGVGRGAVARLTLLAPEHGQRDESLAA